MNRSSNFDWLASPYALVHLSGATVAGDDSVFSIPAGNAVAMVVNAGVQNQQYAEPSRVLTERASTGSSNIPMLGDLNRLIVLVHRDGGTAETDQWTASVQFYRNSSAGAESFAANVGKFDSDGNSQSGGHSGVTIATSPFSSAFCTLNGSNVSDPLRCRMFITPVNNVTIGIRVSATIILTNGGVGINKDQGVAFGPNPFK